jgi:hypothetical protein
MASRKKKAPKPKPDPVVAAAAASAEPPSAFTPAPPATRNELLLAYVAIFALHAFVCMWVRNLGFDHISDDDFSRVTIAQGFAHKASLDPSGTSWLPFPFWILGFGMKILGRQLDTARGLSIFFASAAAPLPWIAMRLIGLPKLRGFLAWLFAFGMPWAVWVGAATVPESFSTSLSVAAVIALGNRADDVELSRRAKIAFGAAMMAACLSRYETWPMAAVLAIALALRWWKKRDQVTMIALTLCIAGPLLWMAWNAHAHDGPLHFFRRVATYHERYGAKDSTFDAATLFPKLLLALRPEVIMPGFLLSLVALSDEDMRKRWGTALLAAWSVVVFLSIGNARDGSATHHSERALLPAFFLFAMYVADVVLIPWIIRDPKISVEARANAPKAQKTFAAFITIAWLVTLFRDADRMPGTTPSEDRSEQLQRGDKLYRDGAQHLEVTPCSYEHFALIAAYGSPENVTVNPSKFGHECPTVEVK